jgi:DMSO/TMAO reductase YedYZ molybdopterin-dependent catalytic subunit
MRRGSVVIVTVLLLLGATYSVYIYLNGQEVSRFSEVEVREYQGEKLGSIADFRENSIEGPQVIDTATYRLNVTGLVDAPRSYTYDQVVYGFGSYEKVVTISCVEGWSVKILLQGVRLMDLLGDSDVRGDADVVIFHAQDGYTSSLPIEYIESNDIILAYKMNGVTLPPERGYPFQVVAESKWGYKWVKWVTWIEVTGDETYRGYWESRGYSNYGGVDRSSVGQ